MDWTILSKWEAHHKHPGRGGIQSISTEEGWEAECYHSGRGERLIIITQGGWEVVVIVNASG